MGNDLMAQRSRLGLGRVVGHETSDETRHRKGENRSANNQFHNGNLPAIFQKIVWIIPDCSEYSFNMG